MPDGTPAQFGDLQSLTLRSGLRRLFPPETLTNTRLPPSNSLQFDLA
jgi:hypothetical protein